MDSPYCQECDRLLAAIRRHQAAFDAEARRPQDEELYASAGVPADGIPAQLMRRYREYYSSPITGY